jgi:hypothetical protein
MALKSGPISWNAVRNSGLSLYCWTGASAGVGLRGVEVPPVRAYTIQTTTTSTSAQIQTRFKLRCGAGSVTRTSYPGERPSSSLPVEDT